jgi:hypothetical protein
MPMEFDGIKSSITLLDKKANLEAYMEQFKHMRTLLTLLRILFLGRIGSISYVLPIRQNIDILNRDNTRVHTPNVHTNIWKENVNVQTPILNFV